MDDPSSFKSRIERVHYIARLMSRNEWVMKRFARAELAAKWGVSVAAIYSYAAEAHRLIAIDPSEREQLRAERTMRFEAIANRAAATFNEQTGMPDFEAEMRALQLADRYAGLDIEACLAAIEAPERIEIVCDEEENEDDIAVPPSDGGDEGDNAG